VTTAELAAFGLGAIGVVAPFVWRHMPKAISYPIVAIGFVFLGWAAIQGLGEATRMTVQRGPLGLIIIGAIAIAGGVLWQINLSTAQSVPGGSEPTATAPPSSPVTITGGDNVVSIGQIGGITARVVTVNPPLTPELRIFGREDGDAPDGTHTTILRTKVVSPIAPGLMVLQVRAQGIKNVSVLPPPVDGVAGINMRNVRRGPDSFSAEIPGPRGEYIVTVATAHPTEVNLDASF